ncbi:MAG TPA: cytochrome P450 [Anaerolineales bacterium]|nr:cytochrome P450 [Anaerolineales bacterium]
MLSSRNETLSLSNLLREEVRADPYPFYAELRSQDPVHWDEEMGFWVLTRYADIASVYNDDRFSRAQGLMRGFQRLPENEQRIAEPVYHSFSKTMFYADPPYHTHLRGLMNNAFTPRRVEQLRPYIQRVVDDLLDVVQAKGQMDLIHDLAYPLPVMVIAELLGLPSQDRQRFKGWSDDLFAILGTVRHAPHLMERAAHSLEQMKEYITALSHERREQPRDDLLSALTSVVDEDKASACPHHASGTGTSPHSGERRAGEQSATAHLTQEELVANINILLSTGHETTTHLIGNGVLALLQNPDQLQKLRQQPRLISSAIDEMMRYENPVQITYRSAVEDVEMGGRQIRKGDLVNSILGSANRDLEKYTDPDRFDITRDEGRHLNFGLGIHFCIGASLVRLEAEIAFLTILRRFPQLQLATEKLDWQEHPIFRGLKSLPLSF